MKTNEELFIIFQKIKENKLSENDLKSLVTFIKSQLKYVVINAFYEELNLEDLIGDVLYAIIKAVNDPKTKIENPIGYIKTILTNTLQKQVADYQGLVQLLNHTKKILSQLEKDGKIVSFNNRKFCIKNFTNSDIDVSNLMSIFFSYDFTEINRENRWSKKKIELLSDFIMSLLTEVKCIEKSKLIDLLKIKMEMRYTKIDINPSISRDDIETDENDFFDYITSEHTIEEDEILIQDVLNSYLQTLKKFALANPNTYKKILLIIYYYEYEKLSFSAIAKTFNYDSPTTIQNFIRKYSELNPIEFMKTYSLLDERIKNIYTFLIKIEDLLLEVLKKFVDDFKDNFQII